MKNKYWNCLFAVLLAAILVVGVAQVFTVGDTPTAPVGVETQAIGRRPLTPYMAYFHDYLTSDKWAILVDLSDRANYPHVLTNKIILKSLRVAGDLSSAHKWHYNVGVVTAVTTATTDIEWIWGGSRVKATQFDERWVLPEHGLSLMVVGGSLDRVATFETVSSAVITSGTEISTTIGVTGTVGVGDLILFTEEISDTAVLHLDMNVSYDTE